jgi:hypothetical protein
MGVGPHWSHDLEEMRSNYGDWINGYADLKPNRYHAGLKQACFLRLGLFWRCCCALLVELGGYNEEDFAGVWIRSSFPGSLALRWAAQGPTPASLSEKRGARAFSRHEAGCYRVRPRTALFYVCLWKSSLDQQHRPCSRNFALHCTRNVAPDLAQPIRSPNKSSSIARFISVPAYPIDLGTLKDKTLGVVAVEVQLVLQSSGVFSAHQFRAFRGETLNSSSLQSWILSLATH